jgi:predicted Rossmann fold flavoprotein
MSATEFDVVIIGAGAAGLMCAIEAGKRGRRVLVLEKAEKIGQKILISGGGRCNFTNIGAGPHSYVSDNEHFCKSALARYSPQDFLGLVQKHGIEYYEKKLGQLFCRDSAREIVGMLQKECAAVDVIIKCNVEVKLITHSEGFELDTTVGLFSAPSIVVATGGLSIPKMGSTGFAYDVAKQFGLAVTETRAGLVPFVFNPEYLEKLKDLSGLSIDAEVICGDASFRENILITHRGLSGPAVLQISSYWREGREVVINLLPTQNLAELISEERERNGRLEIKTLIARYLPNRFVDRIFELWLSNKPVAQLTKEEIEKVIGFIHQWSISPAGTEGYRTAEVTVGGVATDEISSKTFEAKKQPGLYFIGEAVDVTGWLGGYNFQWAWASGWSAGQYV